MLIDLSPVTAQASAPAGSTLVGGVYSTPATWIVEPNPNFPTQANSYRIIRVSDGAVFNNDTRYNQPLDSQVLADACRRAGPGQIIELAVGCDLAAVSVGNTDTGKKFCAYWGPITGPFATFEDLTIRSADPSNKARVRGFTVSAFVRNNAAQTFQHGPCSIRFEHVELHYPGTGLYIFTTPLGENEIHGRFAFWGCDFTGVNSYGSGYDTKTAVRGAYAQWDFQDCAFPETEEHCVYVDAPQGLCQLLRCFNTSNAGPLSARCGRTFMQVVSRVQLGGLVFGGPPGFGTVLVEDCVARRTGVNEFSGALTVAGFLGDFVARRCSFPETNGAMITVWTDWGKGAHTTVGSFEFPPWPKAGSAFTTKRVHIDEISGNTASPWPNQTYPIAISGTELVEIGRIDIDAPYVKVGLWPWTSTTYLGGPFDNGEVRFLAPPLTTPVSAWPGFYGSQRARYAETDNPNQGAPYGTGSNADLSAAGVDALTNENTAYPPWAQPLNGSIFLQPTRIDLEAPPGTVEQTVGQTLFIDPTTLSVSAPAATVTAPLALDLGTTTLTALVLDVQVDAPRSIQHPRFTLLTRVPEQGVSIGLGIDVPTTSLGLSLPALPVTRELDIDRVPMLATAPAGSIEHVVVVEVVTLAAAAPAGSVTFERTIDLPVLTALLVAPTATTARAADVAVSSLTLTLPGSDVVQERSVDVPTTALAATAPLGEVLVGLFVDVPATSLSVQATASSLELLVDLQASTLALVAPTAEVDSGPILDVGNVVLVLSAPDGSIERTCSHGPLALTLTAPDSVVDGVAAPASLDLNLRVIGSLEMELVQRPDQVETPLIVAASFELTLLERASSVELALAAPLLVEQDLAEQP